MSGALTHTIANEFTERTENTLWGEYNVDMTVTESLEEAHLWGILCS